jgi:hypothetical protein
LASNPIFAGRMMEGRISKPKIAMGIIYSSLQLPIGFSGDESSLHHSLREKGN